MKSVNKKIILLFISLFILISTSACNPLQLPGFSRTPPNTPNATTKPDSGTNSNSNTNTNPNVNVYSNSDYSFTINYPKEWSKKTDVPGTIITFMTPLEDSYDQFQENVNVVVEDLSATPMSLEEYINAATGQLNNYISDLEIMSEDSTTIDGNKAEKLIYEGTQNSYTLKWMQFVTIRNNKVYIVTFTAPLDNFDKYSFDAENIAKSLVVK